MPVLKDKSPGTLKLQLPGRHNLLNALGVVAPPPMRPCVPNSRRSNFRE